jgi:hypothetical protein
MGDEEDNEDEDDVEDTEDGSEDEEEAEHDEGSRTRAALANSGRSRSSCVKSV